MDTNNLSSKAVLVGIAIHGWQARKYDRKVSLEVAEKHAATQDAGRFNKHLLPGGAESYELVHKKGRELRAFYYENTLPWSKDGQRILPTANYEKFSEGVRALRREYEMLAREFVREYPMLKEDARLLLNGMFQESDYPAPSEMMGKFSVEIETLPLPAAADFRVDLGNEEVERIQKELQSRLEKEFANANKDLWTRLQNAVDNIVGRLSFPDNKFHDTLISNLQDLVTLIPNLNVTGDSNLEAVRKRCEALTAHSPNTLRNDTVVRADVAKQAREISEIMDAYM
ncbi:MAG: hypothetical protein ACYCSS_14210 [Sulfuriferula sp.]